MTAVEGVGIIADLSFVKAIEASILQLSGDARTLAIKEVDIEGEDAA